VAAIATIALGVGMNAGIFTVLNGVLFRDLPVPQAHELVSIQQGVEGVDLTARTGVGTSSVADYEAYRQRAQTLSGLVAHSNPNETTLGGAAPTEVMGVLVSCNYFAVLQQPPALGRALAPADCRGGADPVVVLGSALWRTTFAADDAIIGRSIELNRQSFTVIGVAAEGTYGGSALEVAYFAPLGADPLLGPVPDRYADDRYLWLHLIGRRAEDATVEQVRAELQVIAAQIDQEHVGRTTSVTIDRARPMTVPYDVRGLATAVGAVLLAAFGFVLLIACANVANLLLARGTAKAQEIAVRLSLGASRARVIRQLLTETLLIFITGGVLGCLLTLWSVEALVAVAFPKALHPELPGVTLDVDFTPDLRVFAYAAALTLATGLLFGLAPALQASRPDLNAVIKQHAAGAVRVGGRLRVTLVATQVALCMALMIATGLLLRGLYATYTLDPGFAYRDVAYLSFGTDYGPPAVLDERLLDEVAALPGVQAVAYVGQTPLGESMMFAPIRLPGQSADEAVFADLDQVTPEFFSLLEIPLVRGRAFTPAESAAAAAEAPTRPVIVSASTARNLWGDADPIGRTLLGEETTLQVVGVAADAQLGSLGRVPAYYVYEPRRAGGVLLVKSRADFAATAGGIRTLVQARDPELAFRVLPLEAHVAWWRGAAGLVTTLGGALGAVALLLAAVGIYGVVSYAVAQRYREIGIRIALGAGARQVLGMVVRQTMRPVAIGAAVGVAVAVGLSRVLSGVLFGVSPTDPLGFAAAGLVVLGVGLAAAVWAARPATRADPTAALRYE
jgi:predicted permease